LSAFVETDFFFCRLLGILQFDLLANVDSGIQHTLVN